MICGILLCMVAANSPELLRGHFERIAASAQGPVGAAAMLLETGASAGFHPDERFPMQSVYKMPIGMAVLREVDQGTLSLDRPIRVAPEDLAPAPLHSPIRDRHRRGGVELSVRDLLRYAVAESDGTASDVLLRLAGGPERVTAYLRGLGLHGIVVATSEKEMAAGEMVQYRNWATPKAMVDLLVAFQQGRGLSPSSRALLMQLMIEAGTGPRRLKGLLPAGTVVAHKTGTSGTVQGLTRATNDAGLITLPDGRHIAIAVFVSDSTATTEARERVIAEIARAAWDYWTAAGR